VTYRSGRAGDVPHLHRMLLRLAETEGSSLGGTEAVLLEHGFGTRALFHTVLACTEGGPIGMAIFYPDFSTVRGEPGVYVQDLFVDPAGRGAGVAQRVLGEVVRMAGKSWGARYLTLGVSPENLRAVRFYDKLGFRRRPYDLLILDGAALSALGPS
jgi:ribosomal protein S18 acetylase RimI-like enzyme